MNILNFETWKYKHSGYLSYERVSKYIVKATRLRGDMPIMKYFLLAWFGKISRYFGRMANVIEYEIEVTEGMQKDIVWKQQTDGRYFPYDKVSDMLLPHLARLNPPTKKVIKNKIYIVDTGRPQQSEVTK